MSNLVSNIIPSVPDVSVGGTELTQPTLSYVDGKLSLVTYSGGHTKTFNYNSDDTLNTLVSVINNINLTKTFNYNLDGTLASVT